MDKSLVYAAPILFPLVGAFLLPVISRVSHALRTLAALASVAAALAVLLTFVEPVFLDHEILVVWMGDWAPREGLAIGISLSIDAWGLLVALVVAFLSLMTLIYSLVYMRDQSGKEPYYVLVLLLTAALIGFCLSGDLFNQFVWLEIFSVAAFALTAFHVQYRASVEAAFKYLITNSIASFFIVIGLTLLYMQTGALNLAQIARDFEFTTAGWVALGLVVGGYATKAALVPWHFWLPDAHSAAPAPISALFSGALIKVGFYAVARNLFTLTEYQPGSVLQNILLIIAALTMLTGGIQMLQQRSLKRILAFSSVSQMGYILLGAAIGTPLGLAGMAMHILSHALAKGALFFGVGMVVWRSGVHDLEEGGGLARKMPFTFTLLLLASLSLVGMPFFGGYISKTMLEEAAFHEHYDVLAWIAVLSSILTFAGLARLLWHVFGGFNEQLEEVREAPVLALLPMALLVAGTLILGVAPSWGVENLGWSASRALLDRDEYIHAVIQPDMPAETHEFHIEAAPNPLEVKHWFYPLLVVFGGSALAYLLIQPVLLRPAQWIGQLSAAWHSGLVTDYALWNSFGTAALMMLLVIAEQ